MKRKVDELGRIVLPIEYRNALNIKNKDELNLSLEADRIIIKKPISSCHFCRSALHLVRIGGETVCKSCIQKLYEAKENDVILPLKLD